MGGERERVDENPTDEWPADEVPWNHGFQVGDVVASLKTRKLYKVLQVKADSFVGQDVFGLSRRFFAVGEDRFERADKYAEHWDVLCVASRVEGSDAGA